jgi:hypothetical protein
MRSKIPPDLRELDMGSSLKMVGLNQDAFTVGLYIKGGPEAGFSHSFLGFLW